MAKKSKKNAQSRQKKVYVVTVVALAIVFAALFFFLNPQYKDTATKGCRTFRGSTKEYCIEHYIGLKEEDAIKKAKQDGIEARVIRIDKLDQGVLDVYSLTLFFEVEDGVVVRGYFEERGRW